MKNLYCLMLSNNGTMYVLATSSEAAIKFFTKYMHPATDVHVSAWDIVSEAAKGFAIYEA